MQTTTEGQSQGTLALFFRQLFSLHSPGSPGGSYVDQAGLELGGPPPTPNSRIKVCRTAPSGFVLFCDSVPYITQTGLVNALTTWFVIYLKVVFLTV